MVSDIHLNGTIVHMENVISDEKENPPPRNGTLKIMSCITKWKGKGMERWWEWVEFVRLAM